MALAKCRECGKEISTEAKTCPQCGAPGPRGRAKHGGLVGLALVALIGFGVYAYLPSPAPETPAAVAAATTEPAKLGDLAAIKPAVDRLPLGVDWQTIEIEEATPKTYSVTLWYRDDTFVTQTQAQADTKSIASSILAGLVKQGRAPTKERVMIVVNAMRHARGETGTALVNWYGNTSYDYNNDSLAYKACSAKSWFGC